MGNKANSRTEQILGAMYILTWIAFIGLMIKTGTILTSYVISLLYPEAINKLYMGQDLQPLRQLGILHYTQSVSYMVALSGMKAYILFLVVKALSKVNLKNPFTLEVVQKLETISYVLLGAWIVSVLNNAHTSWLLKKTGIFLEEWSTEDFIFVAGLVFIISQVFKRGVEIQSENDLTV